MARGKSTIVTGEMGRGLTLEHGSIQQTRNETACEQRHICEAGVNGLLPFSAETKRPAAVAAFLADRGTAIRRAGLVRVDLSVHIVGKQKKLREYLKDEGSDCLRDILMFGKTRCEKRPESSSAISPKF